MDSTVFNRRLRAFMIFIFLVVLIFIGKLFYLQIVHGNLYEQIADRQFVTPTSSLFDRGTIYFTESDGTRVSAASIKSGFKVAINPGQITDPAGLYTKLSTIIPLDQGTFMAQATKKGDPYEEIATGINQDAATKIAALKSTGVTVYRMNWRFYPAGQLASQVIGFMGYSGNNFTGQYGIERTYNDVLTRASVQLYVNFFAQVFSDVSKLVTKDQKNEGDVITTIEPTVQGNLEQMLQGVQQKWNSDETGGIVMDPNTGAIIAMANSNGFDLNNTKSVTSVSQFANPLVSNDYEVGSIMKPIIMSIALDQGAVTPTTTYNDQGFVKVQNRTIYNFDKKGRGPNTTMQTVLNQSLNTGMVYVMSQMNKDAFRKQWQSFGFGQKTGIDLPAESVGLISNLNASDNQVNYANAAFGQGIAVTPVEMIRALAVLANGGHLVTPHIANTIEYEDGTSKQLNWPVSGQLIKPATDATITKMLVTVFDNYDQGTIKFDHYSIAAKTGTAQISDSATGGYYSDRNLHTFMAYFPATNPKFIVFFYNYYPKNGAKYSSDTLLPPFIDLAKFLISYYNIPPDR